MANKVRKMTKDEAVREARIGSKLKGGTWYVTRRRDNYNVVPADFYDSGRDGTIAETIDVHAERAARAMAKPAPQRDIHQQASTSDGFTSQADEDAADQEYCDRAAHPSEVREAQEGIEQILRESDTYSAPDGTQVSTFQSPMVEPGIETAIAITQLRAAGCLCVVGCSVNGECPVHGDGGHLPRAADVREALGLDPDHGMTAFEFLGLSPLVWADHLEKMTPDRRDAITRGLSAVLETAALARGYIDGRYLFGDGDHSRGVKSGNALRTKIRAALGFAYPKSGAFTF